MRFVGLFYIQDEERLFPPSFWSEVGLDAGSGIGNFGDGRGDGRSYVWHGNGEGDGGANAPLLVLCSIDLGPEFRLWVWSMRKES